MNINECALPQKYMRNGKECYLDPVRKKLIYVTPEETFRQRVISYLTQELNVPKKALKVEEHLSHYGIESRKRADIIIHAAGNIPIAVIECKSENVYIDENARDQVFEYCNLLEADYAFIINPFGLACYKYIPKENQYITISDIPTYKDMLEGKYEEVDLGDFPQRTPFDKLEIRLKQEFAELEEGDYGYYISKLTPMELAVPMYNLLEAFLDYRVKMPARDYGLFKLVDDYGVRMTSYGNASGGIFFGPYRSFLVETDGNTEIFSFGVTTYSTYANPDLVKTCLVVAHDDEKESHHALQLVVEDNIKVNGKTVHFYHHGRIAVGNLGSGKIDELRTIVSNKCPELISGKQFYLGSLVNDRLWRLDDPEVIKLVVNLIDYAIIRDEYREYVKRRKKKK